MTKDSSIRLSRRQVLGGLGTIGLASAGIGLGTTAYFSDREVFKNNVLTAGSLDLKVDWEEHYFIGSADNLAGVSAISPAKYNSLDSTAQADYHAFPSAADALLYVNKDDVDTFQDNTTLESYPDANDDRVQDDLEQYVACVDLADLDKDLNPDVVSPNGAHRSANEDTILNWNAYNDEGAAPDVAPLVNLNDVKPGDFGELTLSMHLCDNPGYIWMQGDLVSANENNVTEPEGKAAGEDGAANSTDPANVELLDAIETMLWYDENGNNVYEPGAQGQGDVDLVIVMDRSGSMGGTKITQAKDGAKTLVDAVGPGVQVGLVSFADSVSLDQGLTTTKADVKNAIDALNASGSTNMEAGVLAAQEELTGNDVSSVISASGNARSGVPKVMVVLGDGAPNVNGSPDANVSPVEEATAAKNAGIEIYTIGYGVSSGSTTATLLQNMASTPTASHAYIGVTPSEISSVFGQIGQIIAGEEQFFQGTLRELLALVSTDHGIPLDGMRSTAFDEVTGSSGSFALGDGADPARDPFVASTTNAIGMAWWVPTSVGNEIQSDSVTFDLGFYTEQARHNTGAGQASP